MPGTCASVPSWCRYCGSAEQTQERLRMVFAGGLLLFGRQMGGLLPSSGRYPVDDGASVSPLRRASRPELPPMLLLTGSADQVVHAYMKCMVCMVCMVCMCMRACLHARTHAKQVLPYEHACTQVHVRMQHACTHVHVCMHALQAGGPV